MIGGQKVTVDRVVQYRYSNLVAGEKRSELIVSPAFNVTVDPDIAIVSTLNVPPKGGSYKTARDVPPKGGSYESGNRKIINVTVANNQKGAATASVALEAPAGWRVEPATAPITFAREDEATTVTFTLTPPAQVTAGELAVKAVVTGNGATSDLGYDVVEYPHIHRRARRRGRQPRGSRSSTSRSRRDSRSATSWASATRCRRRSSSSARRSRSSIRSTLASGDLSRFDVIVLGVRAYERRQDLRANNQRLLQYAGNGGTVIVQYQRTEFNEAQYGPFPAKTTADRVTDENAPIEILVPDHPVFNTPNKIGPETWRGWVQERGTYFMGQRDARYVDLLRSQDPFPYNAGAKTGILVEARVGKGRWLYTGLGLWRQLPAGTDGAYRLMANLLSLGKRQP